VAVVVFDADVLLAYLGRADANHAQAVKKMREALEPGTRRLVSAVNYTEVLIGPLRHAGPAGADTVDAMLVRFAMETIQVDRALARRAAAVRVRTRLKLPHAYAAWPRRIGRAYNDGKLERRSRHGSVRDHHQSPSAQ
jgi:uncharacterized protein with PIN domain